MKKNWIGPLDIARALGHPGVAGRALVGLAALGLALIAQVRLDGAQGAIPLDVGLLYGAAALAWIALAWRVVPVGSPPAAFEVLPGPRMDRVRARAIAAGLALVGFTAIVAPAVASLNGFAIVTYPNSPPGGAPAGATPDPTNHLTAAGLILWAAGTLLVVIALADEPRRPDMSWLREGLRFRLTRPAIAALGVTALAAWYRWHDLAGVPREMTSDHTEKLLDIDRVLGGLHPVFFWTNGGREPFEFYWVASLIRLGFPFSFLTLKFAMTLVSIATIPVIYLLGKRLAGTEVGLFAALIAALAPWHIQITRIGLRIAFSPFFAAVVLLLLLRAFERGSRNAWLATGVAAGLGVYGYTGYRPMALVIPAFILIRLAYLAYERRRGSGIDDGLAGLAPQFRRLGGHLFAAGAAGCLVLVPLMRFAYDRPASFLGRTLSRVTAEEHPLMESPLLQLPANVKNALLMFNYTSDSAWFHSPAGYPALETVGGALVVLGAVLMLLRAAHGDWRGLAFLVAVPLLLLSSAMALAFPSENPSLTRSAGAIPVVVVMAALPLAFLGQRLRDWGGAWGSVAFMALCLPLFVWMGSNTQTRYFVKYREQYDNSTPNTSEMAEVINGFVAMGGDRDHAYIVSWSNGPDYRAIGQLIGDIHWPNNLFDVASDGERSAQEAIRQGHAEDPARKLYIVGGPAVQENLTTLEDLYPSAIVTHHPSHVEGKDFWSVFVPGPAPAAAPGVSPGDPSDG